MQLKEIGKFIIRKDIAKAVQVSFPEFTKEELMYILDDQALNVKYAMEHKENIRLLNLGSFTINDTKQKAIDFQTEYLQDKGIELDKLPKLVRNEIKEEIYKARMTLANQSHGIEPILAIRELLRLKNNNKNNVK